MLLFIYYDTILGIVGKFLALIFAVFLSLFIFFKPSWAQDFQVVQEKVNPDAGISYLVKRIGEKFKFKFLFSKTGQAGFYEEVSRRRLAELKYIVETKDIDNIETGSQRYFTTIGDWVNFINQNKMEENKKPAEDILLKHKEILIVLQKTYNDTTAEWRFMKHNIDYVDIYISQL